ncbi:uncharacterized protein [Tenebrio molitor]|uniref:uncharacterized protein n=1 Tax=Tenebrio molitor TaxID=7067 RepID=UPI0036247904
MRLHCFLTIFTVTPLLVTSLSVLEVLDKTSSVLGLLETAWELVNNDLGIIELSDGKRDRMVFSKIDNINMQLVDMNEKINEMGSNINILLRMVANLPEQIKLQFNLNDLNNKRRFIDAYYKRMETLVMDIEKFENSTLIKFGNAVVSDLPNSVLLMIETVYQQVTEPNFLKTLFKHSRPTNQLFFCKDRQSAQRSFYHFFSDILLMNTKSHVLIQVAYMIKKLFGEGKFVKEISVDNEQFRERMNNIITTIRPYMMEASLELWRCDPDKHIPDETYVEFTNFLHGYILNKANLDGRGQCREECDVYSYIRDTETNVKCNTDNDWCNNQHQIHCPKIVNCQFIDSKMRVCKSRMSNTKRRYEYVELLEKNSILGKKKSCRAGDEINLATYRNWVVFKCSYCFCLCDEGAKSYSDRYINLRAAMANTNENRVVTGLRFVKHNRILHLQIQEGRLVENGEIDRSTVRWVPVEDYKLLDKTIYEGQDYHTLSWEQRGFELHDVMVDEGFVVTGARFRRVGSRIDLEVLTTPFNFTTGKLMPEKNVFKDDPRTSIKFKFEKELKLIKPDIPTRVTNTDHTTNRYVQFVNTDYYKDAGQTTVPFFDAQPVESAVPVPLSGIGIYHKGKSGSGGFIAPRIFTYNFATHLQPLKGKS